MEIYIVLHNGKIEGAFEFEDDAEHCAELYNGEVVKAILQG